MHRDITILSSPKIVAATARHTSTSTPLQLPASSAFEKPGTPYDTPHCTKPFFHTSLSRVSACGAVAKANNTPATALKNACMHGGKWPVYHLFLFF